jgi:hypothetical protein
MTNTFYENSQYSDTPYGLKLRQTIFETKATYQVVNAVAFGQYINYTCVNFYKPGQTVTITGIASNNNPSAIANTGFNINDAVILSVTSTSFTVASTLPATNLSTSIGSVTSGSIVIPSNIKRVYAVCIGGGGSGGAAMTSFSLPITSVVASGGIAYINVSNSVVVNQTIALIGMTQVTGPNIGITGLPVQSRTDALITTGYGTPGTATGGTLITGGGAGGGGAGGISAGWTFASNIAQIGRGGESIASTYAFNSANAGGLTVYGQVMAGGGGGGLSGANPNGGVILGGAGGGGGPIAAGPAGATSFTGAPGGSGNGGFGFAGGGGLSGSNGVTSAIGSGGGATNNVSTNIGITNGGSGVIGGGAGSSCTTGVVSSGTGLGGNSDNFIGGSGATGTGILFGGGGGGAGYLANGSNGVGNRGGDGGLGGGGGGASSNGAFSGKGGDGVIFLYY